jgi:uncharacterized membrane protein YccC
MRANPSTLSPLSIAKELRDYWVADHGRLIHAFKTALALVLSMGICMRLELTLPRTAMVSVVIVMMHQQAGMVIARGFYRVVGMIVGSMMGLLLVAGFAQQPELFLIALALWIGACVWGACYYRNYQSYAFVLAGYATSITAVPVWNTPYGIFDSVIYNLSEVAIGVACASFVSAIIIPQRVAPALLMTGQRHCSAFLAFLAKALSSDASKAADMDAEQVRLLADRPMLEALRSAAVFEEPEMRLKNPLMIRLNQDFLDANTGMYSIRKLRVRALQQGRKEELGAIDKLLRELAIIVPQPTVGGILSLDDISHFQHRLAAFIKELPHRIAYHEIQLTGSSDNARKYFFASGSAFYFFVTDLNAYLENFIALRKPLTRREIGQTEKFHATRVINTANRVAALSAGIRAMFAVLIVGALWMMSGWNGGASGLVSVSIATALFAVMPNPSAATRQMIIGCLASVVIGFCFYFFVVPKLDGFIQLAACMVPVILVGSYINTFPKVAVIGLGFNIYFCFIGNITNPYVFDPPAFLDAAFALMFGMIAAAFCFSAIAPWGGGFTTQGYLRQLRALVARMACHAPLNDELVLRFESYVRDFTFQVASQPASNVASKKTLLDWSFTALEMGWSIIRIRIDSKLYQAELPKEWPQQERAWCMSIAQLVRAHTPQRYEEAIRETRRAMDALPVPAVFDSSQHAMLRYRMWALLHAVELSLLDEALPFRSAAELGS